MLIEIEIESEKLLLGCLYRPPESEYPTEFQEEILRIYDQSQYNGLVMIGDFNIDPKNPKTARGFELSQTLNEFIKRRNFFLIPSKPTYHQQKSVSWIDLCIIDFREKCDNYEQKAVPLLSNHDLISFEYSIHSDRESIVTIRDCTSYTIKEHFIEQLKSQNWQEINQHSTIDKKVESFNKKFLDAFEASKMPRTPLLRTLSLKNLMTETEEACRKIKEQRGSEDNITENLNQLEISREKARKRLLEDFRSHYKNAFSNVRDAGDIELLLREIGIIEDKNISTCLLNELRSSFTNMHRHNTNTNNTLLNDILDDSESSQTGKFEFSNPGLDNIQKILYANTSFSVGADRISPKDLISSLDVTQKIILKIFTHSFENCEYPSIWKKILKRPIPRTENPLSLENCEFLSLPCFLSQILEEIVKAQMIRFLHQKQLLENYQFKHNKTYNKQNSIIRTLKYWDEVDVKWTVMFFFGFSRAYDNVNHNKLLQTLKELHFSKEVLMWMKSYLSDRMHTLEHSQNNDDS